MEQRINYRCSWLVVVLIGLTGLASDAGGRKAFRECAGTYKGKIRNVQSQRGALPKDNHGSLSYRLKIPVKKGKLSGKVFLSQSDQGYPENEPITGKITKAVCRNGGKKLVLRGLQVWETGGPSNFLKGTFRATISKKNRGKAILKSPTRLSRPFGEMGAMDVWTGKVRVRK